MELILIAAMARNRTIGKDGKIPWHIPEDIKRFKSLTQCHPVIMGRKTWESLPAKYKPLPDRMNVVLTNQLEYVAPEAIVFHELDLALEVFESLANKKEPKTKKWRPTAYRSDDSSIDYSSIYIIGGQSVYEQALPKASKLELTLIHSTVPGDAHFPVIDTAQWTEVARERRNAYSFVTYNRAPSVGGRKVM